MGLFPKTCALPNCATTSNLSLCNRCRAVSYCGPHHSIAHNDEHRDVCNTIGLKSLEVQKQLQLVQLVLDELKTAAWKPKLTGPGDYTKAVLDLVDSLLTINTAESVTGALENLHVMFRYCTNDVKEGLDLLPLLMLRLGQEAECFVFLYWLTSWRAHRPIKNPRSLLNRYRNREPMYKPAMIRNTGIVLPDHLTQHLTFPQLVTLALFATRVGLDRRALKNQVPLEGWGARLIDEEIVDNWIAYCQMVQMKNPRFWPMLVDENEARHLTPPGQDSDSDLLDQALATLAVCKNAWTDRDEFIPMIKAHMHKFLETMPPRAKETETETMKSVTLHNPKAQLRLATGATGAAFPQRFDTPPWVGDPEDIFCLDQDRRVDHQGGPSRFRHVVDSDTLLMITSGRAPSPGSAGWAVNFGPERIASGVLKCAGTFGTPSPSDDRASVRAMVAALRLKDWSDECRQLIIAPITSGDQTFIHKFLAQGQSWIRDMWFMEDRVTRVPDSDLWSAFVGEVEALGERGVTVAIWPIQHTGTQTFTNAVYTEAGEKAKRQLIKQFIEVKLVLE
ncbi:hypothetical protein QBC47DRAFT_404914 [Echria macrotheca]|uniref:MYND-type domain-containing protein n=1 Tax=Echria macrotheca TaxID=438768 RepID=A0AAJ0F2P8_9PEZI|nr:hypothetical protein QBC47DRAFT_404914 [Echria macrotheca]